MPPERSASPSISVGAVCPVRIDRLSLGGEGVGRLDSLVVFVPYGAPGDTLDVEITEVHARYARARIRRIIDPSPVRTDPPCPYHFRLPPSTDSSLACGGCTWQHLSYDAQLAAKQALVQESFERIAGLKDIVVKPTLGMQEPWRYRNKVQQPVGWSSGLGLHSGFYATGSHDIVAITDCKVQPKPSVALVNKARELLQKYGLRAYQADRHSGWIRHLLVRTNRAGEALLVFVTRTDDFPHEKDIVRELATHFPQLVGIHQNVNPGQTNVILGRHWRKVAGADFIEESLGSLRFRISPGSFFQINTAQAEELYRVAAEYAGKGERLLDLYCGAGGIALSLAKHFKEVGGVEEVDSAIEDAEANAERNGIGHARFQAASVEPFLDGLDRSVGGKSLTVTLDPPRAGMDPGALKALIRLRPGRIVYVSCDPGTLARDVGGLVRAGYHVEAVQPVDLFPQTSHIETVVCLTPNPLSQRERGAKQG